MCIIAIGGFLGRLEPCIRHHFDDIFMYATLCWWHFHVSDMILIPFFIFGHHFFIIFMKMCSPPRQEAPFRKPIFANIVYKAKFPFPKWLQNHYFGGVISVLCCSKNSSFRRLSGKWPSWEAFYMHQTCHWTSFGPNFHFPAIFFHVFYKNVLPAHTGTTILNIDTICPSLQWATLGWYEDYTNRQL